MFLFTLSDTSSSFSSHFFFYFCLQGFTEPLSEKLLPDLHPSEQNVVYTLVLDLNETLLYTDWKVGNTHPIFFNLDSDYHHLLCLECLRYGGQISPVKLILSFYLQHQ